MPTIQTVQLSNGKTAYDILGDKNAEHRILVFGGYHFPRNCDIFFSKMKDTLPSNFAILLYDYFGRGESDAPDGLYDVDFYMKQIDELLTTIGWTDKPLNVLGYSFGGSIATHFAHRYSNKVKTLIYSGAWNTWEGFPIATTIMTKMGLGGMLYKAYWNAMPGRLKSSFDSPNQAIIDNMLKVEKEIMDRTLGNLKKAILKTFRNFSRKTKEQVEAIAEHERPVLLSWGKNDKIASFKFAESMHAIMLNSTLVGQEGNHNDLWLVEEKAEVLRPSFAKFLIKYNS